MITDTPFPNPFLSSYPLLGPIRVIETPPCPPKLQLSSKIQLPDDFRENFNAWLLKRFGRQSPLIPDNEVIVLKESGRAVMTPAAKAALNRLMDEI